MIYFDNNSSSQPLPEVRAAVLQAMEASFGNPSSSHRTGEVARKLLSQSRRYVANIVSASLCQIFFTSGATESNNWVFSSALRSSSGGYYLTTNAEHSSVKEIARNHKWQGSFLEVCERGLIDTEKLERALDTLPALVSVHWVNNETGVIQPVEKISKLCKERDILLHVDGSQAVGKIEVDVAKTRIDFLSFAAHKFHGPQGVGALYCLNPDRLSPVFYGGDQEAQKRPGTENLPGIAGFGLAAKLRSDRLVELQQYVGGLRDFFEKRVLAEIPEVVVNGDLNSRVCNTSNLRFCGLDGAALVAQLDACGIRCSQSSACTSQIPEPSHVLRAMGLSEEEAYSSIRFSFSQLNDIDEIEKSLDVLTKRVKALRDFNKVS